MAARTPGFPWDMGDSPDQRRGAPVQQPDWRQLATDELREHMMTMRHLVALLEADQLPPND
jgi:hypothetical protein